MFPNCPRAARDGQAHQNKTWIAFRVGGRRIVHMSVLRCSTSILSSIQSCCSASQGSRWCACRPDSGHLHHRRQSRQGLSTPLILGHPQNHAMTHDPWGAVGACERGGPVRRSRTRATRPRVLPSASPDPPPFNRSRFVFDGDSHGHLSMITFALRAKGFAKD